MGAVFSHIGGCKFYLKLAEKVASKYGETGFKGVPSAISYNREIFETKVFTELTTGMFCGIEVKIPVNYDLYLTNLYGDYMKVPSEDKREVHVAYKVEF